ncbi:MAG TPA: TIGR04255 family protein [Bacteroidia bacterium]|jgi:uncharacterized protein (TIGR04255 family)|nr:TIGR04255 family protein [Bacteroidia bacterium]
MSNIQSSEIFEKAPIVLAIIQYRYEKILDFDSKKIREIGTSIKKEFPKSSESVLQNIKIDQTAETKVSIDKSEIQGVRFETEDKTKALTVGIEKFTLEINVNYPGWNAFSSEVINHWKLFSPALGDVKLTGLSMRYLNRFDLPLDISDIRKYFTTYLNSDTGNHPMMNFQFKYSYIKGDNIIHLGHALDNEIEGKIPYFFDIDVIKLAAIENNENVILQIFENLRVEKNSIFNDGITEESKKLIR